MVDKKLVEWLEKQQASPQPLKEDFFDTFKNNVKRYVNKDVALTQDATQNVERDWLTPERKQQLADRKEKN